MALVIFGASAAVSLAYEHTVQKLVHYAALKVYAYMEQIYIKLEGFILCLH